MADSEEQTGPRVGDTISGEIADLTSDGAGVMRADGWVIMVRGAFPQDRVRVRLRRKRRRRFEAELLAVESPSPQRIPPECPHLPLCGGCPLQGLAPEAQSRWKTGWAVETLRRIGGITPAEIAPTWVSPSPWYYRNKMEFTFGRRPWVPREILESGGPLPPGPALGLHPRGRYDGVFDVDDCRLQSPLSNQVVRAAREIARRRGLAIYDSRSDSGLLRHLVVRQAATSADLVAVIVAREESEELASLAGELQGAVPEITGVVASINRRRATVAQGDYEVPLSGAQYWHERIGDLDFRIGASSFFQTQTRGAVALIEELLKVGGFGPRDRVLDLYCGVGTFSLPLARRVESLLGVEILSAAVDEARRNAARNGIDNARFLAAPVEAKTPQSWQQESWDLIVLDPPRSGLHPRALDSLRALRPPRIVYVSCNPSTLARDAATLVAEDGYLAARLRLFDLFPQTPHVESVLLLERE